MCSDYLKLNASTQMNSFSLSQIDEGLKAIAVLNTYCTMDLAKIYLQVPKDSQSLD